MKKVQFSFFDPIDDQKVGTIAQLPRNDDLYLRPMRLLTIFLALVLTSPLYCQELIGSSGGESFSIGEVVTTTISGSSIKVTQGFQQPSFSGIGTIHKELVNVKVYPNPTHDKVRVLFDQFDNLDFTLKNSAGKLILSGSISNELEISLESLSAGQYFLTLRNGELYTNHTITLTR